MQVWGWPSRRCQHKHAGAQGAEGDHACDWDPNLLQLIEVLLMSLSWRHTGRQTENVWASWPRAWYWRLRERYGTLFSNVVLFLILSFFLFLSLLPRLKVFSHHIVLLTFIKFEISLLFSVCVTFQQNHITGMKTCTHIRTQGPLGSLLYFFLLHFYWFFGLIISIYHFSLWISWKNHSQWYLDPFVANKRWIYMHIAVSSLTVFAKALCLIRLFRIL